MEKNLVQVAVHDGRGGHDGAANGGHYGGFSKLLVKPKTGVSVEDTVFVVSDEDKGSYQSGHRLNYHSTDRTTVFAIDSEKVEWACVLRGYDAQAMLAGRSDSRSWDAIPGLKGGPKVELQKFLEAYPRWVDENVGHATKWLEETVRRLGKDDVLDAIDYAQRKSSKNRRNSAWQEVATMLDVNVSWGYSWTGVKSAPFKIAMAVQKKYKDSWNLKGSYAFRFKGDRPIHPGEANGHVSLPSYDVKLRELTAETA